MSKLRRKFISALMVLLCAMLALSTALFIPKSKTANAARDNNAFYTIGGVNNDLWIGGDNPFNSKLLKELYKALIGNENATYDTMKSTLESGFISNSDWNGIRYISSDKIRTNNSVTGNKNVSIWFAGFKWDATYITKDRSGNVILDLWMSAEPDQLLTNIQYSPHSVQESFALTYPSNMYSSSYVRVKGLNIGGYYSTDNATLVANRVGQDATHSYAHFTMAAPNNHHDSVIGFLVQPKNVAYQENEYAYNNTNKGYLCPNDAYGTPANGSYSPPRSNYETKGETAESFDSATNRYLTAYGDWQYDYLWLPSAAETGDTEATNKNGIWKTNSALRSSIAAANAWLRSGNTSASEDALPLQSSGAYTSANTDESLAVRPAIHLNLTQANAKSSTLLQIPNSDVKSTYTGDALTMSDITTSPDWYNEDLYADSPNEGNKPITVTYPDDMIDATPTGGEGYVVSATIVSNKYRWADYKTNSSNTRTFKYIINKKKVKIDFSTDEETHLPKAKIHDPTDIKSRDGTAEEIEAKLYFKYKSSDGNTDYGKNLPTITSGAYKPATYQAIICIEDDCNYTVSENPYIFTIPKAPPAFDKDEDLVWVYSNGSTLNEPINKSTLGDNESFKLTYNTNEYVIKIDESKLTDKGVKVKANSYSDCTGTTVGSHTASVTLEADGEEYDFTETTYTLKWEITQAKYDLSNIEWDYADGSIIYNGNEQTVKVKTLPTGLSINETNGYSGNKETNATPEGAHYTAKILSFINSDTLNYVTPDPNDASTFTGNTVEGLWLEWKIVHKALTVEWLSRDNRDQYDEQSQEYFWLPVPTNNTNNKFEVKYYKEDDFDTQTLRPKADAVAVAISDMHVSHVNPERYYAVAFLTEEYRSNYKIDLATGFMPFAVGDNRTVVRITLDKEFTFDTLKHGTLDEIGISVADDEFDKSYIKVEWFEYSTSTPNNVGAAISDAPKNVGKYFAIFTIYTDYEATYVIEGSGMYEFEIKTLVLEVPTFNDTLTYDGTEQDVAKLCGLPEDWENYLAISIIRSGGGDSPSGHTVKNTGSYTVSFRIKDGINDGTTNNVEWNSPTNKTLTKTVSLTLKQLVLHARSWAVDGYYTTIVFDEENAENFVVYKVMNANGDVVDEATFYGSDGKGFTVEVSVGSAHGDNVTIEYANGITSQYKFNADDDGGDGGDTSDDLDKKKQEAKKTLDEEAKKKKDEIDANEELTDEEKEAAKKKVDEELAKGNAAIDGATDINGVNQAFNDGKANIEKIKGEHKEESSFPWWIIAVIAGVLVLLTVIIVIVVKRRNSEDEEEDFYDDEYDYDDEEIEEEEDFDDFE